MLAAAAQWSAVQERWFTEVFISNSTGGELWIHDHAKSIIQSWDNSTTESKLLQHGGTLGGLLCNCWQTYLKIRKNCSVLFPFVQTYDISIFPCFPSLPTHRRVYLFVAILLQMTPIPPADSEHIFYYSYYWCITMQWGHYGTHEPDLPKHLEEVGHGTQATARYQLKLGLPPL